MQPNELDRKFQKYGKKKKKNLLQKYLITYV